jgi:hypothetical protein
MVGASIDDQRVLMELSRRFRQTKPLQLVKRGDTCEVSGAEDFEKRQEYLLRLLDYYWFSKQRVLGMTRSEVEAVFGPLGANPDEAFVSGGRDTFAIWFKKGRVSDAYYAIGY